MSVQAIIDALRGVKRGASIITQELPRFMDEPHAEGLKGVLEAVVPQTPADVGLTLATGPWGKGVKLGGAALAGLTASSDAEAGGVAKSVGWLLKQLRQQGLASPQATSAVRNIQTATRNSANEHFWPGFGDRVYTSNSASHVQLPTDVVQAMQVNKPLLQAHSHPKNYSIEPSFADFKLSESTPATGALIVDPYQGAFSYHKAAGARRVDPAYLEDYAKWVKTHANDARGLDWAEQVGLTNSALPGNEYGPYEAWLRNNATLLALRHQEVGGKLKTLYNPGKVQLPDTKQIVPGGGLVDEFYDEILR